MDIPLELSFHNLESSDALKAAVRAHVDKLEQFHDHIVGCRVVIEMPHKSQKASGNPPNVHIVIRVPGKEIVVSREAYTRGYKKAATDAYAVLDEAFTSRTAAAQGLSPRLAWRCEIQKRRAARRGRRSRKLEPLLHRRRQQRHLAAMDRHIAVPAAQIDRHQRRRQHRGQRRARAAAPARAARK